MKQKIHPPLQDTIEHCRSINEAAPSLARVCKVYRDYITAKNLGRDPLALCKHVYVVYSRMGPVHVCATLELAHAAIRFECAGRKPNPFRIKKIKTLGWLAPAVKRKRKGAKAS